MTVNKMIVDIMTVHVLIVNLVTVNSMTADLVTISTITVGLTIDVMTAHLIADAMTDDLNENVMTHVMTVDSIAERGMFVDVMRFFFNSCSFEWDRNAPNAPKINFAHA
jgi:hypothetical protein